MDSFVTKCPKSQCSLVSTSPPGGPCRRITDICSASLVKDVGQRGVQPQPRADQQGLLMAAVPPLSPDSSADTPLHEGGCVWGGPLHENLEYSFP